MAYCYPIDQVVGLESYQRVSSGVGLGEDRVRLQTGDSRIVPLNGVYEEIERNGKRGVCKNVFHCSECGKKTEDFGEEVLAEMERRYNLTDTKIYLRGDGAP